MDAHHVEADVIRPVLKDDSFLADVRAARTVDDDGFRLWWLGQSGFLLQWRERYLLFDPYLSDSLTEKYKGTPKPHVRMSERVIAPERLHFVDVVTSTHNHTDHLDRDTLVPLLQAADAGHEDVFLVVAEANYEFARHRVGCRPEWWTIDAGDADAVMGFEFWAVPAAHDQLDVDGEGRHLYLGYVVRFGNSVVYHSGDTVVYPGMVELLRPHRIDIAILPINGKVGNMGGRDAARLAKDVGARLVIPCHYDMFEFNTADPRDEFIPECEALGQPYRVLKLGERFSSSELPPR
jgi:L-ascorbate metabolism protein UlaG (beta-lactamase superfamily)